MYENLLETLDILLRRCTDHNKQKTSAPCEGFIDPQDPSGALAATSHPRYTNQL